MTIQMNRMRGTHVLVIFAVLGGAAWPPAHRANRRERAGESSTKYRR